MGLHEVARAQPFDFPTANRALLERDGGARFFVGTAGKPWTSGQFGCVRSGGWQMHEGIDIRCLQRDRNGEPTDAVKAVADGTVAYCNRRAGLSNYGNYVVLRHEIDGIEVYSLYAHLREIRRDLVPGQPVRLGEAIAVLGRSSNTRQSISKDRAHLHLELDLFLNDRFSAWYRAAHPKERDDHGRWNGQNFAALDVQEIFQQQAQLKGSFSLRRFIRSQTELCRVLVPDTRFPWLSRYPLLVMRNPAAEREGAVAYEVALNYNGVPFQLVPRAGSEIKGPLRLRVLSVNEAEVRKRPCRKLVTQHGQQWVLARNGQRLIELLTY
jgi:murein DD-endopeptidase MepM/ murein hydrolase activator NlpD